jgi:DNA polymerase-3 subunit alpha
MAIAVELAGFSREAANALRKKLGKKRLDVLDQTEGPFVDGCIARGIGKLTSASLFKWLRTYGEYTITRAHALARTGLAWQQAALKARHPEAFEAALSGTGIRNAK